MPENTAVAVVEPNGGVAKSDWYDNSVFERANFERELVWTVKQTVFPKATNAELMLFLTKARSSGLDPTGQIVPVKFNTKHGPSLSFITTRTGFQSIAERTGNYGGSLDFTYDDGLSLFEHVKQHGGAAPTTATATVLKWVPAAGEWVKVSRTVYWQHYYPADKKKAHMWDKMPHTMLSKCAEAAALRAAFPLVLAELYVKEEFDQAERQYEDDRSAVLARAQELTTEEQLAQPATLDVEDTSKEDELAYLLDQHEVDYNDFAAVALTRENVDPLLRIRQLQSTPLPRQWTGFFKWCLESERELTGPKSVDSAVSAFFDTFPDGEIPDAVAETGTLDLQ